MNLIYGISILLFERIIVTLYFASFPILVLSSGFTFVENCKADNIFPLFLTSSTFGYTSNSCTEVFWCRFWLDFKLYQTSIHKKSKRYVNIS